MEVKIVALIAAFALLALLIVSETRRRNNLSIYRLKIGEPHGLLGARFELRLFPGKPPEYFVRGERVGKEEEPFLIEDLIALAKSGIVRQVEYLDHQGRVIPDTPEFCARLQDYEDTRRAKQRIGKEKLARSTAQAPYSFRREYYITASAVTPRRQKNNEPTFV